MKYKKHLLSLFLIIVLVLTGCNLSSIPTNANTAFRNFTLDIFRQEISSNTLNLHYCLKEPEKYGISDTPITLGSFDINEVTALAYVENMDAALHKFSYRTLSEENQLTYDILSYYFTSLKKNLSFRLYEEPLSPVTGIHAQLPVLLAEYQFYTKKDVDTYLALLSDLPDYFSSLIRFEQQKSVAGLFMSDELVDTVISQCADFISMGESNYLISTFKERLQHLTKISSLEYTEYVQKNHDLIFATVIPAYQTLSHALSLLKGSGKETSGLCHYSDGKSYYSHLVSTQTGSGRSVLELKTLIYSQIQKDLIDSQKVLSDYPNMAEPTGTISDAPDSILDTLETKIANAFPAPVSVEVQVKSVPEALEPHLSPAFYLIPAIDNFTENTIYINGHYNMDNISLFTTLAHEGYPGHLYQTTYFANTNPDPIRTLLSFTGYVEGWATYAEMCSYYISSYEKPYATLLQKNNSIILGLYAAADIGIHYDGWSLQETINFFSAYGITDETAISDIYTYIVGDPANYLTYYVGYLEILELKKEKNLSQKEFHRKLLEIGPAPFDIIRKYF